MGLREAPAGSRLGERYGEWCVSQQTVWGNYLRSGRIRWCNDDPGFAGVDTEIANMRLSSAVWSFCANRVFGLGSDDLARLSSNTVLVAGADNLLFWILPTLFLSVVVRSGPPVKDVVVHPLILDEQGRKMSKSLGNVVSPDAILERHGADALRLSVLWRLDLQEPSLRFRAADVDAASALIADLRAALCSLKSRFPVEVAATWDADCRLLYRRMDDALARYDFANAMNGVKEAAARLLEAAAGGSRGERYRDYLRLLAPFMPGLAAEFLNERELQRSVGAA
jgi:valyl-tRNA synthetase